MKTLLQKLTFLTALSIFVFACNNEKHETTVTTETEDGVTTTETRTTAEYEAEKVSLKDSLKAAINALEVKIDALDETIEKEKGEQKAKLKDDKEALKAKNRELKERLDKVDNTTEAEWDNFKREFKSDMNDLGNSIENFFKKDKDNK